MILYYTSIVFIMNNNTQLTINSLRCWQLNLHRSQVPAGDLSETLLAAKHFIALIQEPNFYKGEVRGFSPTFNIFTGSTEPAPGQLSYCQNISIQQHCPWRNFPTGTL